MLGRHELLELVILESLSAKLLEAVLQVGVHFARWKKIQNYKNKVNLFLFIFTGYVYIYGVFIYSRDHLVNARQNNLGDLDGLDIVSSHVIHELFDEHIKHLGS
jgi:hypothetical protein